MKEFHSVRFLSRWQGKIANKKTTFNDFFYTINSTQVKSPLTDGKLKTDSLVWPQTRRRRRYKSHTQPKRMDWPPPPRNAVALLHGNTSPSHAVILLMSLILMKALCLVQSFPIFYTTVNQTHLGRTRK